MQKLVKNEIKISPPKQRLEKQEEVKHEQPKANLPKDNPVIVEEEIKVFNQEPIKDFFDTKIKNKNEQ